MKRLTFISLLVISALMLTACGLHTGLGSILNPSKSTPNANGTPSKHIKATHTAPSPDSISINAKGFNPETLTVKTGATVTWANATKDPQSFTSDTANLFGGSSIASGATYTYTFMQAGTFTYHSTITPAITGKVIVTP